jgi:hypothetical protein
MEVDLLACSVGWWWVRLVRLVGWHDDVRGNVFWGARGAR